jgi:hypothetical protein
LVGTKPLIGWEVSTFHHGPNPPPCGVGDQREWEKTISNDHEIRTDTKTLPFGRGDNYSINEGAACATTGHSNKRKVTGWGYRNRRYQHTGIKWSRKPLKQEGREETAVLRSTAIEVEVLAKVLRVSVLVLEPTVAHLVEAAGVIVRGVKVGSQDWNTY